MDKKITKNQHYVPQFLLRHFSCDTTRIKRINIFDINRSAVRNQSIEKVFSQNYFYDKDNRVENFINENIEAPASRVIDEIANGNFNVIDTESSVLHRFILSLFYRTPEAVERASKFVNSQLESGVRELLNLNGFDPKAGEGSFKFRRDRLASLLTVQGTLDSIILEDLKYHIIKNETQLEFYISDHPVFIYNWLYRNLEHPGVTSLTSLGLQIFLPLSPKLTLCLYDPKVYKYGQRNLVTCISDSNDVDTLNSFQIVNADSIIGFCKRESETNLKHLYGKHKDTTLHQYESGVLSIRSEGKGKIRSTHYVFTRQAKLKKMPSFVKIRKNAKGYASCYQERDSDLSERFMGFKRFVNEQRQHSVLELNQNEH